ncbi:MAG: hypothetical protein O3C10_00300 [Chloroflexi bacterium]|nr:hypothetical protein [Chloroflexota bacterium]
MPTRRVVAPGHLREDAPPNNFGGTGLYVAVPGYGDQAPGMIRAEATMDRYRPVLPVLEGFLKSTDIGVVGGPVFQERLRTTLRAIPPFTLVFESAGPLTEELVADLGSESVVIVDGETGRQLALRAPGAIRGTLLNRIPILLVADSADFQPPREVAAVIGRNWSVLLTTSAQNPLRLGRTIRKISAGRSTIDTGIDPNMVRYDDELSDRRNFATL